MPLFKNREEAGELLAGRLLRFKGRPDALVLAIPRGGVVVGAKTAGLLGLGLDVLLTKKIGHPLNPEFAVGVVSLHGFRVDEELCAREGISSDYIEDQAARIRFLLRRRQELYGGNGEPLSWRGKSVLIVDDGAATGLTLLAAVALAREGGARESVAAVPVASPSAARALAAAGAASAAAGAASAAAADSFVSLAVPESFLSIGQFYEDFPQVDDAQAVAWLERFRSGRKTSCRTRNE